MSTFWLMRHIILMRSCNFLRELGGRRRVPICRASMATHSDGGWKRAKHTNSEGKKDEFAKECVKIKLHLSITFMN